MFNCLPQFLNHVGWAMWSMFLPRVASSMYEDILIVSFFLRIYLVLLRANRFSFC